MRAVQSSLTETLASPFGLWAPVVAYMALIFSVSASSSPPAPRDVSDKLLHAAAYALLALLALRASSSGQWSGVGRRAGWTAFAVSAIYGVTDEVHQAFVPGRSPEVADALADAIGAGVATAAIMALAIIRRSRAGRRVG